MRLWGWIVARLYKRHAGLAKIPFDQDQEERLMQARAAAARSERILNSIDQRDSRVNSHLREMEELRRDNGFAAIIEEALRGK